MKRRTKLAFLILTVSTALFLNQSPVRALEPSCESFGDWTMGYWESNCYPSTEFCEVSDSSCWSNAGFYSCEAWYGICLDIADPCKYWCCCRVN